MTAKQHHTNSKTRIGAEIRRAREAAGMTQAILAGLVGIKQPYLSAIELGKHLPGTELLKRLAAALDSKLVIGRDMVAFVKLAK